MKVRILVAFGLVAVLGCERLSSKTKKFEGTGCLEDPAVAVVEVKLATLEARSAAWTAPEGAAPTLATMVAAVQDALLEGACVEDTSGLLLLGAGDVDPVELGALTLVFLDAGAPFAGGLVDTRTGEVVLTWQGEDAGWASLCTPADVAADAHDYARAPSPENTYTYIGSGSEGSLHGLMDDLNFWGAAWAEEADGFWRIRDYFEIEEIVRHTEIASAFAECGEYDIAAVSMTAGGGLAAGDTDDLAIVFVLSGLVDGVVVD